jgi:hypothetical protein
VLLDSVKDDKSTDRVSYTYQIKNVKTTALAYGTDFKSLMLFACKAKDVGSIPTFVFDLTPDVFIKKSFLMSCFKQDII